MTPPFLIETIDVNNILCKVSYVTVRPCHDYRTPVVFTAPQSRVGRGSSVHSDDPAVFYLIDLCAVRKDES